MNPQILFDAAVIVALVWFWMRRARPTLIALRAEPMALRLGLLATVACIAAMATHLAAIASGSGEAAATWIRIGGGLLWIVIVGLGYPQYRFLRHATGTKRGT